MATQRAHAEETHVASAALRRCSTFFDIGNLNPTAVALVTQLHSISYSLYHCPIYIYTIYIYIPVRDQSIWGILHLSLKDFC